MKRRARGCAALKDCLGRLAPKALELICQRYYLAQHAQRNREAFVELGASFREAGAREEAPIRFMCKVYVFEGKPTSVAESWPPATDQPIGSGAQFYLSTQRATSGWKTVSPRCVLPHSAGFLVVQIGAGSAGRSDQHSPQLGEQFATDIRLTLHTHPSHAETTAR